MILFDSYFLETLTSKYGYIKYIPVLMLQILIYEKCHGSVTFLRLCDYLLGIILPAWKFAPPFEMTFSHVNVIVEY